MQNLFSYPLYVEDMGSGTKLYKLEATAKQLAYITEVLKVDGAKSFWITCFIPTPPLARKENLYGTSKEYSKQQKASSSG